MAQRQQALVQAQLRRAGDSTAATSSSSAIQASWPVTTTRFFAVDGANGNDANPGYSDVSAALAGAVAKKTLAGISAIIPTNGAGRVAQLYIASGTYTDAPTFLSQLEGYAIFGMCGTGTQANAGSVAFAGTLNTDVFAGGITVPGLNAAGYNPTGAPTTRVIQMVLNGGGAPGLPAEPAAPLGWRIRFDIATATAALRGVCKQIYQVSGTDTVSVNSALSVAPSAADVFYIEKAGVIFSAQAYIGALDTEQFGIIGCDFQNALFVYGGRPSFAFSGASSIQAEGPGSITCFRNTAVAQVNATSALRNAGGGLRNNGVTGNLSLAGCRWITTGYVAAGTGELLNPFAAGISDGSVFVGFALQGGSGGSQQLDGFDVFGGATATFPVRFVQSGALVGGTAGLLLRAARVSLKNIDFTNMGAHPAIMLAGNCTVVFVAPSTGSTGNTDVGLDLTAASGSTVVLFTTPTVTGTAGDVRLAGGTIITWAQAAAGVIDANGNTIFAPGNAPGHPIPVAAGAVAVTITNAPAGSPATPARYVKYPDGNGGFYTFPSLT